MAQTQEEVWEGKLIVPLSAGSKPLWKNKTIGGGKKKAQERQQSCLCGVKKLCINSPGGALRSQFPMLIDIPIKEISRLGGGGEGAREQRSYRRVKRTKGEKIGGGGGRGSRNRISKRPPTRLVLGEIRAGVWPKVSVNTLRLVRGDRGEREGEKDRSERVSTSDCYYSIRLSLLSSVFESTLMVFQRIFL